MIPNNQARSAADNGQAAERWRERKRQHEMIAEFGAIEQLAERISIQCGAQLKIASMLTGYKVDDDSLRAIRLAVNSMTEALDSVERLCAEVDRDEFGIPAQAPRYEWSAQYGGNLEAIEEITGDLSVLANAEAYVLKLIVKHRRPAPEMIGAMRYLHGRIRAILG